ncbi:TonB-dependent receptor [uncultured Croceicoccus sp.]|uniref:TonB-dependent receptor domain-containing protein n=1 Tax=uncultured Croceicoccus sp. TaxID=1295329 RepID=UPI0026090E79|nr:TonB-dependent receptor [uncultured Croceicoccus sp.]
MRATIALLLPDGLSFDLSREYGHDESYVPAFASHSFNVAGREPGPDCTKNGFVDAAPLIPDCQCIPLPQTPPTPKLRDSYAVRGEIECDGSGATVTDLGGYRFTDQDTDLALSDDASREFDNTVDTMGHELRIGGVNSAFTYQAGVFFYQEKGDNLRSLIPFIAPNASLINAFAPATKSLSFAGFRRAECIQSDQLTLMGGLRSAIERREGIFGNYGLRFIAGPVAPTTSPSPIVNLEHDNEQLPWLAGMNYTPNADALVSGKVSIGYKSGGFGSVGPYEPATKPAYEAGAKSTVVDRGQPIGNFRWFHHDYTDLQAALLPNPAIGQQIFNAGDATIYGLEVEGTFEVTPGDNGLADRDPVPAVVQPDLSRNTLPRSVRLTIAAGSDPKSDIGNSGVISAGIRSRIKSSYFLDIFNQQSSSQGSFSRTELGLKYEPAFENRSMRGLARNRGASQPSAYASFVAARPDGRFNFAPRRPRALMACASATNCDA